VSGPERLDFADPAAVRRWLLDLRVAVDDAGAVTEDALRPLRRRDLGHVKHRQLYRDAREKIASLLDYADPPCDSEPDEGGPGDPSGCASPFH
jgi:hypothetical protein